MNVILVLASAIGFICLAAACLKVYETGPTIGPAFSPAARLVLLLLVFMFVYSAIEALAWRTTSRPGASVAVFVLGLFSIWRVFAPDWASFFTRPSSWQWRLGSPPKA